MRFLLKFSIFLLALWTVNCASRTQRPRNRVSGSTSNDRIRKTRTCSPPRLMNGFVTPLFRGKMMRFDCNKGYSRLGERYSECTNGRWSLYSFPICIKSGCPTMSTVDNGKISYMNGKATAMLFCEPNFEIVGSNLAHCNGTNWDRAIGTCKETDNLPPTTCDFETETICGWMHDTNNDLDFERRSGYNNKTILIQTGPSADHTIGVPFQGHYMVINTNTEVFTKKARLISPLYRIYAEKLCFQLYYHMYGISVGTLKVYVKPESVELQDILIEDMETEAKNDYVIFEIKDTQGNSWQKGSGMMKKFNESFQIIIEAISGQTRLSDIAIDDVSILTDEDCDDVTDGDDNETDAKENDIKEESEDNSDGIFSIESCVNRCFEESSSNSTVHLNANKSMSCSCSRDCYPKSTCCPDFLDVCMKDDSSLGETTPDVTVNVVSTTISILKTTLTSSTAKTSTSTQKLTIPTTVVTTTTPSITSTSTIKSTSTKTAYTTSGKITISSTKNPVITTSASTTISTTQKPSTTTSKASTTRQSSQESNEIIETRTDNRMQKKAKSKEDFEDVSENKADIEDEYDMKPEETDEDVPLSSAENATNEKYTMHTEKANENVPFIFSIALIGILSVLLVFAAFLIVYKQYRKSTNPLNYKENNGNGTKRADEEFSEIRYLTSDEEALDFSLASPSSATDL